MIAWEQLYNPNFKVFESEHFRKQVGLLTFTPSVSEWRKRTNAIGMYSKMGKYGGTYAHKDINTFTIEKARKYLGRYTILKFDEIEYTRQSDNKKWHFYNIIAKKGSEKVMENNNQQNKTNINWYPGHMAKTKREITEDLKLIDVVIEILDSRIPISSQNPDIAELIKEKKKIIVLNKTDLADPKQNELWIEYFKKQNQIAILVDSNLGKGINNVLKAIEDIMKDELDEYAKKGRIGRKIRVMILGIPNVGKSSFINRIVKTNRLEVGNKPGVTRKKQWININEKISLLDTPGVLWPRFKDEKVALNLAFTGTIKDDVLEQTEIAYELIKYLLENEREKLIERYKISNDYIEKVLSQDQPENFNVYEIMQEIGRKRGAIVSGGNVDDEKIARILLDDFRSCKLGRITVEKVKE